ncbi:MAG: hypothetical protein M0Z31_00955 [Clostridia bacterium]|nr:hypothetical protein [Clostridia bacterium]
MIGNLVLSENAYFYKKNPEKNLSSTKIETIFRTVSRDKSGHYYLNEIRRGFQLGQAHINYSVCVFKFKSPPSFLDDDLQKEVKFAYLLIVEYMDYVIINKKNISGLDKLLGEYISGLDYSTISQLYISDNTAFEKFTMNNMDISDKVIRRRNIEAINLKDSFAPLSAGKYILNSMRVRNSGNRYSLSFNVSRINKLGKRVNADEYFAWVIQVVDKIRVHNNTQSYLDHFAIPLEFNEQVEALKPNSILFTLEELHEHEDLECSYVYNGREKRISLNKIISTLAKSFEIETEERDELRKFFVNIGQKKASLRVNRNSFSIVSEKLKLVQLKFSGNEQIDLQTYINKNQLFIICFEDIDFVYSSKKLFKDSALRSNLEYFLGIFKPFPELSNITQEKGGVNPNSTFFDTNSLFSFTENVLASTSDYLVCDDFGDEWADYISIKSDENIVFFHAKKGKEGLSASNFHEVVSQAQKNLGNMFSSSVTLGKKREKWTSYYSGSNIPRLRKGDDFDGLIESYKKTLLLPNTRKEIYLVVNFISKSSLERQVTRLKNEQTVRPQIIQIIWLLSSLVLSCKVLLITLVDGNIGTENDGGDSRLSPTPFRRFSFVQ